MAKIQPELSFLDDGRVQLTLNAPGMDDLIVTEPPKDAQIALIRYLFKQLYMLRHIHTYYLHVSRDKTTIGP